MNLSGQAVLDLLQFYKIDPQDLLVIVDEAQLDLGRLRARPSGSSGGHNGLKSVIGVLGTENFPRLRIGVGRGDARRDLGDHVLARFDPAEKPVIDEAVQRAADAAETFVREQIVAVMNGTTGRTSRDDATSGRDLRSDHSRLPDTDRCLRSVQKENHESEQGLRARLHRLA